MHRRRLCSRGSARRLLLPVLRTACGPPCIAAAVTAATAAPRSSPLRRRCTLAAAPGPRAAAGRLAAAPGCPCESATAGAGEEAPTPFQKNVDVGLINVESIISKCWNSL